MTRSLSAATLAAIASPSQDVAWLLTIHWPEASRTYAQRDMDLPDHTTVPDLLDIGSLTSTCPEGVNPAAHLIENRLSFALTLDGPGAVRQQMTLHEPEGLLVEWHILFIDADARFADAALLFEGRIEQTRLTRFALEAECHDLLYGIGHKRFGQAMGPDAVPEPGGAAEGGMMPWIFGKPGEVELLPWRSGLAITLAENFAPEDYRLIADSLEGVPDSGILQVGDERIAFHAVDRAAGRIGTGYAPLSRLEPAWHNAGAVIRIAPEGGFEWLVAGHPCQAVERVRAEGVLLPRTNWAAATEDWQGRQIQKMTLQKWPTMQNYRAAVETFRLSGETTPGGWDTTDANSAIFPFFALNDATTTYATLTTAGNQRLDVRWKGNLAGGIRRYGFLTSARLIAQVSSDTLWESTTRIRLQCRKGDQFAEALLPRPDHSDLTLTLPSHTHGDGGVPSDAIDIPTGLPLTHFSLDLTDLLSEEGEWDFLDGSDGAGFTATVLLDSSGDPVSLRVHTLHLEISYRARGRTDMAELLTAEVEGYAEDGLLLENPADLVCFFLTHQDALGFDIERIDAACFAAAKSRLDTLGYVFSNRLASPRSTRDILRRLLFESRCHLQQSQGLFTLHFQAQKDRLQEADFVFEKQTLLQQKDLTVERTPEREVVRAVGLHYGRDFTGAEPAGWRRSFLAEQLVPPALRERAGREYTHLLHWHNHGMPGVVVDLARRLLAQSGLRNQSVRLLAPLKALTLETLDHVALEEPYFPLVLDQGRVREWTMRDPHRIELECRFAPVGPICWSEDAATFIRHGMNNSHLEIWIEGLLVATLRWDGLFRLRGSVTEEAAFSIGSLSAPLFWQASEDRLYFSSGSAGVFTPRFAMDGSGNLFVAGTFAEETPRADLSLTDCIEAAPGYFAKAVQTPAPALIYDVASGTLQITGTLAERERFA